MRVDLHAEARDELEAAAAWYDANRYGLGEEFLVEVRVAFARISENASGRVRWPGAPQLDPPIRRVVLDRFPYAVGYQVFPQRAVVLAVAHHRREPFYWQGRVG